VGRLQCLFRGEGLGSHLTQCGLVRGVAPYQVASILIHPAVWPQYTNVTDRTGRTGLDRQRSDSTRRTVLQTVARKRFAICHRTVVCPVCPVLSSSHGKDTSAVPPPIDPCLLWPNCRPSQQLHRPLFSNKSSAVAEMGNRLTARHGPKGGGGC